MSGSSRAAPPSSEWGEALDDHPGSLADPAVRSRRHALLGEPHVRPLAAYVRRLRRQAYVPDFDPLDGGTSAKLLILMEKPGPKTVPPAGSGFVSCNTGDPTAKTIHRLLREAAIPRAGIVLWNVVPWWNGTVALTGAEKRAGAAELPHLLGLLPQLRAVLLAGNPAWEWGAPACQQAGLAVFRCVHPSGQARAGPASRERWLQLPHIWREAWQAVTAA